jgi:hypothetical protein
MNDLYQLRKLIETNKGNLQVILPITGGTFGIPKESVKEVSLAESGITEEDLKNYTPITTGPLAGSQYIIVQKTKAGGLTVDQQLFFQRSDINVELADKIATILTTKAELKGRQLSPEERKAYFEIFINNARPKGYNTNRDRIQAKVLTINNQKTLVVELNGKRWLLDIKTSNSLHTSYDLQLAAYAKAWNETHNEQIEETGILWLKAATRGSAKDKIQGAG